MLDVLGFDHVLRLKIAAITDGILVLASIHTFPEAELNAQEPC